MPGEFGLRPEGGVRGQLLEVGAVHAGEFAGQQVGVDRFGEQGMPEGDPVGVLGPQHVMGDGLAQGRIEGQVVGEPGVLRGDGPQQRLGHPAAGYRRDAGQGLHRWVEPFESGMQDIRQRSGKGRRVRPALDQLLGEVGVALRPGQHPLQGGLRQHPAGDRLTELGQLVVGEGRQLDVVDLRVPQQFGQDRAQRMTPVQIVGAVGADHQQVLPPQPGEQEPQDVAAGRIGPVQVLDHQHQRTFRRPAPAEDGGDPVEQLQSRRLVFGCAVRCHQADVEQSAQRRSSGDRRFDGVGDRPQLRQRLGER